MILLEMQLYSNELDHVFPRDCIRCYMQEVTL